MAEGALESAQGHRPAAARNQRMHHRPTRTSTIRSHAQRAKRLIRLSRMNRRANGGFFFGASARFDR
jgi:hypothetical protein